MNTLRIGRLTGFYVRYRTEKRIYTGRLLYHMRPNVASGLAERIEEYVDEGVYASGTEFVNDAVRRRLEELEEEGKDE